MKLTLTYERNTRRSSVYTTGDYGSVTVTVYIPKRSRPPAAMEVEIPDWTAEGGDS